MDLYVVILILIFGGKIKRVGGWYGKIGKWEWLGCTMRNIEGINKNIMLGKKVIFFNMENMMI